MIVFGSGTSTHQHGHRKDPQGVPPAYRAQADLTPEPSRISERAVTPECCTGESQIVGSPALLPDLQSFHYDQLGVQGYDSYRGVFMNAPGGEGHVTLTSLTAYGCPKWLSTLLRHTEPRIGLLHKKTCSGREDVGAS